MRSEDPTQAQADAQGLIRPVERVIKGRAPWIVGSVASAAVLLALVAMTCWVALTLVGDSVTTPVETTTLVDFPSPALLAQHFGDCEIEGEKEAYQRTGPTGAERLVLESAHDGRRGCITFWMRVTRRSSRSSILGRPRFDLSNEVPKAMLLESLGTTTTRHESLQRGEWDEALHVSEHESGALQCVLLYADDEHVWRIWLSGRSFESLAEARPFMPFLNDGT